VYLLEKVKQETTVEKKAVTEEVVEPKIVAFMCNWCTY
jgi:hypothetical protein